jgi:hypothetical protein
MAQDPVHDRKVRDPRQDHHGLPAAGTGERLHLEDLAKQLRPRLPTTGLGRTGGRGGLRSGRDEGARRGRARTGRVAAKDLDSPGLLRRFGLGPS